MPVALAGLESSGTQKSSAVRIYALLAGLATVLLLEPEDSFFSNLVTSSLIQLSSSTQVFP